MNSKNLIYVYLKKKKKKVNLPVKIQKGKKEIQDV